jgi:ferritin-like metal-binding protein YciE
MSALRTPNDLLNKELKEIYSAERQLSRAIPKLTKAAKSEPLKEMLERRREQGSRLIEDLDDTLEARGVTKARPKNIAVEGLIEDLNQHIEEIETDTLLDVAMIGELQKIEHYCIAAWGTSRSMARLLEEPRVVEVMERVLDEGKQFDTEMTEIAEREVNPRMTSGGQAQQGQA